MITNTPARMVGTKLALVLGFTVFATQLISTPRMAFACGNNGGFLPENSLKIPVGSGNMLLQADGMNEAVFNQIIDKAADIYSPLISQKGGRLQIIRDWRDGTVNAYADRQGSNWIVKMYGGLARHQTVTPDGFALVVCHELGHHLGGVPHYPNEWAANEGQADYFATLKCLRRVWNGDDNVNIVKSMNVPGGVKSACEQSFADANAIAVCQRTAMAGLSSANLSRALAGSGPVDFSTPDRNVVPSTSHTHPQAQCRLDTYYQGSICQVRYEEEIGQSDPTVGTCSMEKNDQFGYRPLCWYKPGTGGGGGGGGGGDSGIARPPTINGQTDITINNPYQQLAIDYDVSGFQGATGAYLEFVGPNRDFTEPNGVRPDPYRVLWGASAGVRGRMVVNRPLTWGVFKFRVIPLGGNGSYAVGKFSNGSTLRVQPGIFARRDASGF